MYNVKTYTATSASDPTPIVELATEIGDEVGGVFGVRGLDQMVIVGVCALGHDGIRRGGRMLLSGQVYCVKGGTGRK